MQTGLRVQRASFGTNCYVSRRLSRRWRPIFHIMQHRLRVRRTSFGKDCHVSRSDSPLRRRVFHIMQSRLVVRRMSFGTNCDVSRWLSGRGRGFFHILQRRLRVRRTSFGTIATFRTGSPCGRRESQWHRTRADPRARRREPRPGNANLPIGEFRHGPRPCANRSAACGRRSSIGLLHDRFRRFAMGVQSGHVTSLRCPLTTPIGKVFQPLFCGVPPKALPRSTSVKLLESPFFRAVHGLAFVAPREPAFRGASVESKLRPRCSLP
jgi:hypothetical protein